MWTRGALTARASEFIMNLHKHRLKYTNIPDQQQDLHSTVFYHRPIKIFLATTI